jgi:hypothetical protein
MKGEQVLSRRMDFKSMGHFFSKEVFYERQSVLFVFSFVRWEWGKGLPHAAAGRIAPKWGMFLLTIQ